MNFQKSLPVLRLVCCPLAQSSMSQTSHVCFKRCLFQKLRKKELNWKTKSFSFHGKKMEKNVGEEDEKVARVCEQILHFSIKLDWIFENLALKLIWNRKFIAIAGFLQRETKLQFYVMVFFTSHKIMLNPFLPSLFSTILRFTGRWKFWVFFQQSLIRIEKGSGKVQFKHFCLIQLFFLLK